MGDVPLYSDVVSNAVPELRSYFQKEQDLATQRFMEMCAAAQKAGDVRSDLNLEFLPLVVDSLNKLSGDREAMKRMGGHKELMNSISWFFLYGIAPEQR